MSVDSTQKNVTCIELKGKRGNWLGNVILEYNDSDRWGRLYSITDYGNYAHQWDAIGPGGFVNFLRLADPDYLIGKLAMGHDEAHVLDVDATVAELCDMVMKRSDDADYLGEAIADLKRCETGLDLSRWHNAHEAILDEYEMWEHLRYGHGRCLNGYKKYVIVALQAYLDVRRHENETAICPVS